MLFDREVWPAGDSFGAADAEPEEDFMALREILFADLGNSWSRSLVSTVPCALTSVVFKGTRSGVRLELS